MDVKLEEKQDRVAQTEPMTQIPSGTSSPNQGEVDGEAIFAYLAKNPDIGGLMREYPQLTGEL
jgi:hypothetical protein